MTKHISGGSGELCEICYPTTPEMFAEHREKPSVTGARGRWTGNKFGQSWLPPGFSSGSVSRASTRVWKEQSGMRSALLGTKTTAGPAFIPAEHLNSRVTLDEAAAIIGDGYVWHAATDYTGAGWVRPHGSVKP